jgi:hypothetical protein
VSASLKATQGAARCSSKHSCRSAYPDRSAGERRRGRRRRVSVRWLCLRSSDTLPIEEQAALDPILAEDTDLARGCELRLRFHAIVNTRDVAALDR